MLGRADWGMPQSENKAAAMQFDGLGTNTIIITDNRTGKSYSIPVEEGHYVNASAFKQIIGPDDHVDGESGATHSCVSEGLMLYDPSFVNTAVTRSSICWVDGDNGVLLYRGYPIEVLIEKSNYLEVAYLLIYGHLPSKVHPSS